jgi:hypothetical protein
MTAEAAALLAALAVAVLVGLVALLLRRRQRPDAPTQPRTRPVPAQLDRADFARPETPWLVVAFTSANCLSCRATVDEAQALAGERVAVEEVEVGARGSLHARYGITAVPIVVVADADGVVRASFVGPPEPTELSAAVHELLKGGHGGPPPSPREPGQAPP